MYYLNWTLLQGHDALDFLGEAWAFALSTRRDSEERPKTSYDVLLDAEGPKLLAEHL